LIAILRLVAAMASRDRYVSNVYIFRCFARCSTYFTINI